MEPPRRTWKQKRSVARRSQQLESALAAFAEHGFEAASVEDIARRAGASVGSLYHQFGSKGGLAAEVYLEGLRRFQQAVAGAVEGDVGAREGVLALVASHVRWVEANPGWARFLLETRRQGFLDAVEGAIREQNRGFGAAVGAWARPHFASGAFRPMSIDLFLALLLGPAHEYVRGRLGGRPSAEPEDACRVLGEGAFRAVGT